MSARRCSVDGCAKTNRRNGLCDMHSKRVGRTGQTARKTLAQRLDEKVERRDDTSCWLWTGALDREGYGRTHLPGARTAQAHRVFYTRLRGAIGPGLDLDHLCRVRNCVNPDHLEPVTPAENTRRGLNGYILRSLCRSGAHDITAPGAIHVRRNGAQTCAECMRATNRRAAARYRARRAAVTA